MAASAELVASLVSQRTERLRRAMGGRASGRGQRLIDLVAAVLDRIDATARDVSDRVAAIDSSSTDELEVETRALLRLLPELDGLHRVVAAYVGDVGRQDLPVGLLHMIDRLIEDVLPDRADPIVHLDNDYMYSTLPLVQHLIVTAPYPVGDTTDVATTFDEPHPVVFNLPALDPANALLTPILAHEVGHSASRTKLLKDAIRRLPLADIEAELRAHVATIPASQRSDAMDAWTKRFSSWLDELLCDAVATVLTGPSFLFASSVFLPGPAAHAVGSHPHERDRLAFCLRLLDKLGWTPFLNQHTPVIFDWCSALASTPILDNTAEEAFLRRAMELSEPHLVEVATDNISAALDPHVAASVLQEALVFLAMEVPPVEVGGRLPSIWELVLFGWVSELTTLGGMPPSLVTAVGNGPLNGFLIKCLELVSVRQLWEEAPGGDSTS